jgi:thiol-disulfide isomerase/thioredoxin
MSGTMRAAFACAALLLVAGCTGVQGASGVVADQSYVSGPGTVTKVSLDRRGAGIALSGTLLDGGSFDVADHRGKVVVVNVWGSWCPPCRAEAPGLQRIWADVRGKGVQLVGIDTRDSTAAAQAFERRFGITYPSVTDEDGELLLTFRDTLPPNAIPSTIVLDRQGRVAARIVGATTEEKLRRLIDDVLAEDSSAPAQVH